MTLTFVIAKRVHLWARYDNTRKDTDARVVTMANRVHTCGRSFTLCCGVPVSLTAHELLVSQADMAIAGIAMNAKSMSAALGLGVERIRVAHAKALKLPHDASLHHARVRKLLPVPANSYDRNWGCVSPSARRPNGEGIQGHRGQEIQIPMQSSWPAHTFINAHR